MKNDIPSFLLFIFLSAGVPILSGQEQSDPFLWLEDIDGQQSLEWVKARNGRTVETLTGHSDFKDLNGKILSILNSRDKIAYPSIQGEMIYNFWQDEIHKRGIWRRTPAQEYAEQEPEWETVLDMDSLSDTEAEKWAFKEADFLCPDLDICMVRLSRGGSDAVEIREFDLRKKSFVENGFSLPQAKGGVSWIDRNTLLVATDFGPGTLTESGYPRIVKIWKRGTALAEAETLFSGNESDMGVWGFVINTPERQFVGLMRMITFFTMNHFLFDKGELKKIDIPEDAQLNGFFKNQMLVELKSDWTIEGKTYRQGALIGIDADRFLKGDRDFHVLRRPDEHSSLVSVSYARNYLLVNTLNRVRSELYRYTLAGTEWKSEKIPAPDFGALRVASTESFSDLGFFEYENFLIPGTLYRISGWEGQIEAVKSLPHFFKNGDLEVKQMEARSKDGTPVPYFLVAPKNLPLDGSHPTLLYGYGGFEISETPYYSGILGSAWLEKGGVYALANIRGGGEFGPKWHQAALKENRQRAFDDFIAVSEDLIRRKITSPSCLGIMGGSNGGLLVGVAFTQRPDLFSAVVCQVPLLDMQRYNKLLAGASWMGEYGNPDIPGEWEYIRKYSPFHNLAADRKYPKVLFTTTTRDDRVHPGHARKMAAKMESLGHDFFYYENIEGGHGSGVTNEQRAFMRSLEYMYLWKMLK
ncbi:S9 family peptidase [bacterium]|nr:S9 family peptidase [bacterium]